MFDAVTYGAAVGAAKKYTDEQIGSDDAVKYTEQSLTSEQQAQARENIGAAASDDIPTDAVKYTAQTLTDAQKTQARTNIGVAQPDWRQSDSSQKDYIKNKPPIINGTGTGGNLNGGTGMNNMNEATKQNSIAYGYGVSAKGDYSAAFGYFLQALHDYEIAYGKFNQSNADTVFSIGDGTSNSDKHNLMELKTDGTLLLNGNAVKTEGGDDKLRLGTVFNNGKYGIGEEGNEPCNSVEFSTEYPSNSSESFVCKDFVISLYTYKYTVVPLRGLATGKTTTGAWVHAENCFRMFFKTGSVTKYLKTLDLSMIDTSEVSDMTQMFYGCTALETLDISSFDMTNVVEYGQMFGVPSTAPPLTTLKTPKINPHDDIPLNRTLYSQDGTAYTNLPITTGTSIELRQSWT